MKYNLPNDKLDTIFEIIIILICVFLCIPAIQIIQYNIPGASDDFFHGFFLKDKPYFEAVKYWYQSGYNGRYTNALIMQLPGRPYLEPSFGKTFPIISFLLFYISQTYFIRTITKHLTWSKTILFSSLLFVFFLAHIPGIRQFYWFSGLSVYIIPMIFYYLILSLFLKYFNKKQTAFSVITIIISLFFIMGSNENWMIMSLLTVGSFVSIEIANKRKLSLFTYFIIAYTLTLSAFVIFSPGTTHRLESEGTVRNNQDFFASITTAFFHISFFVKTWFFNSWFIVGTFLIFLLRKKSNPINLHFKAPTHVAILGVILIVYSGIFIMLFSLGYTNPIRVRGLIPVYFISSLLLVYAIYKISQSAIFNSLRQKISNVTIYTLLIVVLILSISNSKNMKNVYHDLNTGNAKQLAEQSEFIINYIKQTPSDTVLVPNITVWSEVLYPIQISEKPQGFNHWITSTYFNKKVLIQDKSMTIEEFMKKNTPKTENK